MIQDEMYEDCYAEVRDWNAAVATGDVHHLRLVMVKDLIARMQAALDRSGLHENGPAVAILAEEIAMIAGRPFREWVDEARFAENFEEAA
ncbi:hypothetical protein D6850_12920 [Roseovarius spongiae]|uniref:Uncharacterized protein n=1 Tax=Roseovarius spongiae TaxID=2320272 RepID=A0A3A8ASH1_9RHOB|nr:hypothetical protein [Roseovarius spongiae]RKF14067.1 hypothetical protein D6850_12920 [Roseovarius spongiae]